MVGIERKLGNYANAAVGIIDYDQDLIHRPGINGGGSAVNGNSYSKLYDC
jgi:hypothetical protein